MNAPKINKMCFEGKHFVEFLVFFPLKHLKSGTYCAENNIQSLRPQSWVIAQYPEIANQSNCAILGDLSVAYTNILYTGHTLKIRISC